MTDDGRQMMAKAHTAFGKVSQAILVSDWLISKKIFSSETK
jgi:hypothetical protein